MRNNILFGFAGILVVGIILFSITSLVSSQDDDSGPYIDPELYDQFNNSEWVEVIIDLKNISEMDDVFSNFSQDEIKDVEQWPLSPRIDAKITEAGFYKLINDTRLKSVYFAASMHATGSENDINDTIIGGPAPGYGEQKNLLWTWIAIGIVVLILLIYFVLKTTRSKV